jgi:hypothetical protein
MATIRTYAKFVAKSVAKSVGESGGISIRVYPAPSKRGIGVSADTPS